MPSHSRSLSGDRVFSPARIESMTLIDRSFLVQKFGKLQLGQIHAVGYSVAGEETVVQIPELNVCFDIGRAPQFALTSDIVCLSHAHMDHLAGLAYYLSQRHFQGMKPGIVLCPRELEQPIDNLLRCWRDVERQGTPYTLVGLSPQDIYEVRKDFLIRAIRTHHGGPSLGYSLVQVREKLKQEYYGLPSPKLVELKQQGVAIQYRVEIPLVTYLGDTTFGPVFEHPDVIHAQILITECTFYDADHITRAKVGKHLHLDQFVQVLPTLENDAIVLIHVSRRTGVSRAKYLLRKRIGTEAMQRVHFLMDFSGARDAGAADELPDVTVASATKKSAKKRSDSKPI